MATGGVREAVSQLACMGIILIYTSSPSPQWVVSFLWQHIPGENLPVRLRLTETQPVYNIALEKGMVDHHISLNTQNVLCLRIDYNILKSLNSFSVNLNITIFYSVLGVSIL